MAAKQREEDLAGYDLSYNGDGGYTQGTIRVITEPIPVTALVDFLHRGSVISAAIELEKGRSQDHQLILATTLVPELHEGAHVVNSGRYGGGSVSYFSRETAEGKEAVHVVIDVSEVLQRLITQGRQT